VLRAVSSPQTTPNRAPATIPRTIEEREAGAREPAVSRRPSYERRTARPLDGSRVEVDDETWKQKLGVARGTEDWGIDSGLDDGTMDGSANPKRTGGVAEAATAPGTGTETENRRQRRRRETRLLARRSRSRLENRRRVALFLRFVGAGGGNSGQFLAASCFEACKFPSDGEWAVVSVRTPSWTEFTILRRNSTDAE
jgi:hypothetical protein